MELSFLDLTQRLREAITKNNGAEKTDSILAAFASLIKTAVVEFLDGKEEELSTEILTAHLLWAKVEGRMLDSEIVLQWPGKAEVLPPDTYKPQLRVRLVADNIGEGISLACHLTRRLNGANFVLAVLFPFSPERNLDVSFFEGEEGGRLIVKGWGNSATIVNRSKEIAGQRRSAKKFDSKGFIQALFTRGLKQPIKVEEFLS